MTAEAGPVAAFVYGPMLEACRESLLRPPAEWTFKSDPRYQEILEHLDPLMALEILAALPIHYPAVERAVLDRLPHIAAENDSLGQPTRFAFPSGLYCSPSNLRYLWHALLFLRHLRTVGATRPHVVEIGAGYGGLALYVYRLADLFSIDVERYTTIDLPAMAAVQAAFGRELALPLVAINGSDPAALAAEMERSSQKALFSAYAFAEFDQVTQDWYSERVVRFCEHGLMVWNYYHMWRHRPPNPIYPFMQRPFMVTPDLVPDYRPLWDMQDVLW